MATKSPTAGGNDLAGSAMSLAGNSSYAAHFPQDRIIAQEVNLGLVRELVPPQEHIGLSIAPWLAVAADDVVFDYIRDTSSGLAPARAEDAESQLWTDDEMYSGRGRASVIDWALKNWYSASDVTRYREMEQVVRQTEGQGGSFPLTVNSILEGFQAKVTRHATQRRRRLDNRIEWMITQALSTGHIVYDDGKIEFDVNFLRPSDQHNQAAASNSGDYSGTAHDPINDILGVVKKVYDKYGVTLNRAICSRAYLNSLYRSSKFVPLSGWLPSQGITQDDMPYVLGGWGPKPAIQKVEEETGVKFIESDNVLRTRVNGSKTFVNTRYFPENQVIFLPNEAEIQAYDDTEIGFAKTLTSPHPMGNWQPGFYAWEQEDTDPWGRSVGTGVKAFPIFPHMELTYTMLVDLGD